MAQKKLDIRNFKRIKNLFEKIVNFDLFKNAYLMARFMDLEMKKDDFLKNNNNYLNILYKLKWLALPLLADDDIFNLFQNYFKLTFEIKNYDLKNKFKNKLVNDVFLEDRDEYKKKIKDILLENQEKITKQKIIINNNLIFPTVAHWLKDFNIYMGGANFVNNEKRNEYFSYNKNIKKINKEEQQNIRKLIEFYDTLKKSSLTPEGIEESFYIEEDNGIKGVIEDGLFIKIDKKTENNILAINKIIKKELGQKSFLTTEDKDILDKKDKLEKKLKKYKENSLEYKAIQEELEKLKN